MNLELTTENVTFAIVTLHAGWTLIKELIRRTPSKRDDALIDRIQANVNDRLKQIKERAPYFWAVVEAAEHSGILPDKAAKPVEFLKRLRQVFGELSPAEERMATGVASDLSAETKKP